MDLHVSRLCAGLKRLAAVKTQPFCLLFGCEIDRSTVSFHEIFIPKRQCSQLADVELINIKNLPLRDWWKIWTTHVKYWSLNLKWWSCASAAWFGSTACARFNSPDFCVPPTFLQGLLHVFVSCGRVVSSVKKPSFLRVRRNVLGCDGKCLCLRARAATFSGWRGLVQQPDVVHLIHRATSVQWLERWVGQVLKSLHQPLAHKNRKDSFSEERLSDWLKRIKSV